MTDGSRKWVKRGAIAAALLLVAFGLPNAWYGLFLQPGAAIVKGLFETGEAVVAGPGVPIERDSVTAEFGIPVAVDGAPEAHLDLYTPNAASETPRPIVLWVHGGGFISNASTMVEGYATVLADSGYVVASLDYSLAPGERYPAPILQANAALAWLREHAADYGGDPDVFFVGGDSAGSQIASQIAAVQTNSALASAVGVTPALDAGTLRGAVLFCGLYDMDTVASTNFPFLRTFLWAYTGQRDWENYPRLDELSTTQQATADFPATFLVVGDADPFEPQAHELQAALEAKGVTVVTEFWDATEPGLGHEYQFDFRLPQSRTTLDDTLAFLAEHSTTTGETE